MSDETSAAQTKDEILETAEKKKTPLEMIKERQAAQRASRGGAQPRGAKASDTTTASASSHNTKPTMPLKTGNKGA